MVGKRDRGWVLVEATKGDVSRGAESFGMAHKNKKMFLKILEWL
jgi:hypothetical protein